MQNSVRSILLELRPRLKSCNICIRMRISGSVRVRVQKQCLIVNDDVFHVSGVDFAPTSLSGLRSFSNVILFHVQVSELTPTHSCRWILPPPVVAGTTVSLSCHCGWVLAPEVTFKRVLPLPSSQWETADAFCHGGDKSIKDFRPTDCLYATHFIHISKNIASLPDNQSCPSCFTPMGEEYPTYTKLWTSNVAFSSVITVDPLQQFIAILQDVISDPLAILPKILLEGNSSFLPLCVLDKTLKIFRWMLVVNTVVTQKVNLQEETVLKVEYSYHPCRDGLVEEWEADSRVHVVPVPDRLLIFAHRFLTDSHYQLPPGFNRTENGTLAYVPLGKM